MARVVEKTIKKFLGGAVKSTFTVGGHKETEHGVNSINGYIRRNGEKDVPCTPLLIKSSVLGGINTDDQAIQLSDGTTYFPIFVYSTYTNKTGSHRWQGRNCFFIEQLRRPNLEHLFSKMTQLFKEEYNPEPNYQFKLGRYVFWLENFPEGYLSALLREVKNGDGSTIDYTWIAPLQELIEAKVDNVEVKAKRKTTEKAVPNSLPRWDTSTFADLPAKPRAYVQNEPIYYSPGEGYKKITPFDLQKKQSIAAKLAATKLKKTLETSTCIPNGWHSYSRETGLSFMENVIMYGKNENPPVADPLEEQKQQQQPIDFGTPEPHQSPNF